MLLDGFWPLSRQQLTTAVTAPAGSPARAAGVASGAGVGSETQVPQLVPRDTGDKDRTAGSRNHPGSARKGEKNNNPQARVGRAEVQPRQPELILLTAATRWLTN